jgi:hypothetical protein
MTSGCQVGGWYRLIAQGGGLKEEKLCCLIFAACCAPSTCRRCRFTHLTALLLPACPVLPPSRVAPIPSLGAAGSQVPETDSVLASTELQELLEQHAVDLHSLTGTPFDSIVPPAAAASSINGNAWQPSSNSNSSGQGGGQQPAAGSSTAAATSAATASSSSGGYLEHVFRTAARELFGRQLPPGPLAMKVGRNPGVYVCNVGGWGWRADWHAALSLGLLCPSLAPSRTPSPSQHTLPCHALPADLREVSLDLGPGAPPLRFAAAYGFRNIQGLMRKVKLGRCEYDYVEVMACPSGGYCCWCCCTCVPCTHAVGAGQLLALCCIWA